MLERGHSWYIFEGKDVRRKEHVAFNNIDFSSYA
jgi:hypothetical protein